MTELDRFLSGIIVAIQAQLMSRGAGEGARSSVRPRRAGEHGMELIQVVILAAGLAVVAVALVATISSVTNDTASGIKTK